jgi:hypothetical protein
MATSGPATEVPRMIPSDGLCMKAASHERSVRQESMQCGFPGNVAFRDPKRYAPAVLIMTAVVAARFRWSLPPFVIARSGSDAATSLIGVLFRGLPRRYCSSQ